MLTHYRLRKLEARSLGLTSGESGELEGITAAGSAQPREAKYGLLQGVLDKINALFTGTDVDETNGVSAAETILRHVVDNPKIQAEAMANTPIDFQTSPTVAAELEDVMYASAAGHSNAMKALLQKSDFTAIVRVLVAMGLYEKTRSEAERTATAG
ncbi:hypothetical protein [Microbacterium invictum]|uniref:Uncharacterized protein n=1 Tax=Microbacterium invictum TaxID=515415 RepID=A0AA40SQW2_9MICO|nr:MULTISPECIES: hypothetical protein [Microbacterium]MBB4140765.1 hypothetical protein [Microbacterium invictum]